MYYLISQNDKTCILKFKKYIKSDTDSLVKKYLTDRPDDTVELCKEKKTIEDIKIVKVIKVYLINPDNDKPSLIYVWKNRILYKALENQK